MCCRDNDRAGVGDRWCASLGDKAHVVPGQQGSQQFAHHFGLGVFVELANRHFCQRTGNPDGFQKCACGFGILDDIVIES